MITRSHQMNRATKSILCSIKRTADDFRENINPYRQNIAENADDMMQNHLHST